MHPERITKANKNIVNDLDMKTLSSLSLGKTLAR